jgi:disulfide bond formation protein DsbB
MIKFSTYCKIYALWITFYSYWLINYFVLLYAQKNKSNFYIILACFYYGIIIGLVICGVMTWLDYHPSFAPEILEPPSLSLSDLTIDNLDLKKQQEFETQEQVKKKLKTQTYIWVITTLIVYYVVFTHI